MLWILTCVISGVMGVTVGCMLEEADYVGKGGK